MENIMPEKKNLPFLGGGRERSLHKNKEDNVTSTVKMNSFFFFWGGGGG